MKKRFVCFVLTMVLCFVFTYTVGEGLLPSLSELEDAPMPSLGSVLHRYPDNETVNSDKSVEQFWYDVSNEDYIAFSNYLSTQDVQLKDYSAENNQITATIEKNGKVFFFTYIPDVKQAIVVYPAGTCDAREKEAAAHYNRAKELAEEEKYDEACEELCAIEDAAWYKDTAYLNKSYIRASLEASLRQSGGTALPDSLDETRDIEIAFWAKNDSNKSQVAVYQQAVEGFQQLYPNVKVELRLYTDYGRIYSDVLTNLPTGTAPNVCITYPDHVATYQTSYGTVVPLDDLMNNPHFGLDGSGVRFDAPKQEEMIPEFLRECVIGGQTYAIPYMRSTEALYVNEDLVKKLGYELPDTVTWDFVWEVSEKALEKNEDGTFRVNGQETMIPFIYKSTDNMLITMLKQLDAPYASENGEILLFNDTTKGLLEEIYNHGKSRAFSTFAISSYPCNFLNAGQCIFAVDSTAGATWMGSGAPMQGIASEQIVPFNIRVMPVPQFDPDHPKMISQGPSLCLLDSGDPQELLASWLFVQYLLTDEIQTAYARTEGYLPVTLKALQSREYQEYLSRKGEDSREYYSVKIEASELLYNNLSGTFTAPVFKGSVSVRSAAGQLVETACKSGRRKRPFSAEDAFSDVIKLYNLDSLSEAK